MTHRQIPIVCTLSDSDAGQQALEWVELQSHTIASERIEGGAAPTVGIDLADAVEDLAAREATGCTFLSLTTHRTDTEIRLEITSESADALAVIESLTGLTS